MNVYAPLQRELSTDFFTSLDVYLLDSYATFLVGNFNCVLDAEQDVRGPGQGKPYRRRARFMTSQDDSAFVMNGSTCMETNSLRHGEEVSQRVGLTSFISHRN